MTIIRDISEEIEEELDDSEKYAKLAIEYKDEHPDLAEMYMSLSNAEMDHVNKLHDAVTRLIKEHREKHGEPPAQMLAVYDYLHTRHTDHAARIKAIQSMYRR